MDINEFISLATRSDRPVSFRHRWRLLRIFKYLYGGDVVLWVDHALGGGTSVYSQAQFRKIKKNARLVRLQYLLATDKFVITLPNKFRDCKLKFDNLASVYDFCAQLKLVQIVVNSVVAWRDVAGALDFVTKLKNNSKNKPYVVCNNHDFFVVCPSYNLLNCDGDFCNLKYPGGCQKCWRAKVIDPHDNINAMFHNVCPSVRGWRTLWGNFLGNVCDCVVVFSGSSRDLILRTYPELEPKLVVIPHTVPRLGRVKVASHSGINIAFIGQIGIHKGSLILREMCDYLAEHSDIPVQIYALGYLTDGAPVPKNLVQTGPYKVSELSKLIRKHRIDVVFISSICPETFSYTTSEAMSMNVPVVCYNIGAPAERVAEYNRGLVLDHIAPVENMYEIINFVENMRNTKGM